MARRYFKKAKRIIRQNSFYQTEYGLLSFLLVRSSARRSLTIAIDEKGQVQVSVPYNCPDGEIYEFIVQKARWIFDKVEDAKANQALIESKRFEDGHAFSFLGKLFRLNVKEKDIKRPRINFNGFHWHIEVPEKLKDHEKEKLVRSKLIQWYKEQAHEIIASRTLYYSREMQLEPQKIAIRSFKRLWGNCDFNTQTIQFNWQIILSPLKVIDYVIVHELCHLIHPNHSKRFWRKVEKFMPDFREHKRWLSDNHVNIALP